MALSGTKWHTVTKWQQSPLFGGAAEVVGRRVRCAWNVCSLHVLDVGFLALYGHLGPQIIQSRV